MVSETKYTFGTYIEKKASSIFWRYLWYAWRPSFSIQSLIAQSTKTSYVWIAKRASSWMTDSYSRFLWSFWIPFHALYFHDICTSMSVSVSSLYWYNVRGCPGCLYAVDMSERSCKWGGVTVQGAHLGAPGRLDPNPCRRPLWEWRDGEVIAD